MLLISTMAYSQNQTTDKSGIITVSQTDTTVSPEYLQAISEYLTVSKTREAVTFEITRSLPLLKKANPNVPGKVFDELADRIGKAFHSGECDMMYAKIFQRHLSLEEIKGVVAFFKSPLGEKYSSCLMRMTEEIKVEASKFGEKVAQEFIAELMASYLEED